MTQFELLEASIAEVLAALERGLTSSVAITEEYLARIAIYDQGPGGLNSVPVLNPNALAEAEESDRRWREGRARPLEGVPFTVKDSYMVAGLTVASGSPAFEHLVAQWDAFSVERLRAAGAVLLGKTTMPPMAAGGMQRGVYGRPESPYNRDFLPAAFGSGSSSGSAVSVAANLAVFSMAEETLCSGRSPASNNALCAYTPSWGIVSIRGNWPLFPSRDVVVPYTRTMPDLLRLLDVLVQDDPETRGDFWRCQDVVPLPVPSEHRPESYLDLERPGALAGRRVAVPAMYLGEDPEVPIRLRPSVRELWERARERLTELGAEVVVTDFPLMKRYEAGRPGRRFVDGLGSIPGGWTAAEFREFMVFGWDDFLRANGDPAFPGLGTADPELVFPHPPGALPNRYEYSGGGGDPYVESVLLARRGVEDPRTRPDFADGLRATVALRAELFEDWLAENGFDAAVFPTNADVGAWNSDIDEAAADHAWSNGVAFSNGNYALRHLGIPTVTVPMGVMDDTGMPVGLTFAGAAYDDPALLAYAADFESRGGSRRRPPRLAPEGGEREATRVE